MTLPQRVSFMTASAVSLLIPFTALALGVQVIVNGNTVVFNDVPQSAWFATYVRTAAEAGIVNGYKDVQGRLTGKYGPENRITVAEALKIAVEGAGYDEEAYARKVHSGVDHWASAYVSVAKSEHFPVIADDIPLNRSASRGEVAAMLAAAFRVDIVPALGTYYEDVGTGTEFSGDIEALTKAGIVSGDTDIHGQATGTFRPFDAVNRAEVAKMVMNARAIYGIPGEHRMPPEEEGSMQHEENLVTYSDAGFSPSVLRIQKGDTVTFRNESTAGLWVASDPHPVHTDLSSFDALRSIGQGEIFTYTFTQIGTWGFHNHMHTAHTGTIIVE